MSITKQIATLFRHVYFGGNWTGVNYKDTLAGVSWQQATAKVQSFNTIAVLVFHTHYYINTVSKVLKGEPLTGKDKYSFEAPLIQSEEEWQQLLNKTWAGAEDIALLTEQLPETKLSETFVDEKYGNYYRNLHGIIEHLHYHLGQIVFLKKMIENKETLQPVN